MQQSLIQISLITDRIARAALWIAGIGLVLMTIFIAAQVFWRYILNDSLPWSEPAAVMIMGWFIFLGAAVGIREGYHLSFDIVLYLVSPRVKLWLFSLSDLFVSGFGVGMIWYGSSLAYRTAGNQLPSLGISGAFDFIPIVGGGILIVLFSVERIARRAAGLPTVRFGDAEIEE
ncbi:MAG: TRAP transporter small permease [Allorhizobium sp.]